MPKYVLYLLVKPIGKEKNLLSVLRYRLARLEVKGKMNVSVPSDVINRSKSIDCTANVFRCVVHSEARTVLDNLTKIQSSNAWISS